MEVWKVECYIISKDVSDCTSEKCWCVCACLHVCACVYISHCPWTFRSSLDYVYLGKITYLPQFAHQTKVRNIPFRSFVFLVCYLKGYVSTAF